ncbi:MAG: N-acetylmuramoyl-L-alanine amidase [Candidatus Sulfotelmatobacter sp.]
MATTSTKAMTKVGAASPDSRVPTWRLSRSAIAPSMGNVSLDTFDQPDPVKDEPLRPAGSDALQALLAFSALHQQVRQRRALAARYGGFETVKYPADFEPAEEFVLDEVLQLVAERAIAVTGADGVGIALAENNEIVLRASAGTIKPDVGARIQRDSAFSGACFRRAQIIRCDDTETDDRVNLSACRKLGARSMVAVPLCGRRRVIGLLEAFSTEPFGFNDSDTASLELLAELIVGALKPEDEDRFAQSAEVAEEALADSPRPHVEANHHIEKTPLLAAASAPVLAKPVVADDAAVTGGAAFLQEILPPVKCKPLSHVEELMAQLARQPAEPSSRHPGAVFVSAVLVIFVLLAVGLWWKLKSVQTGRASSQPTSQTAMNQVATKPPPTASVPANAAGVSSTVLQGSSTDANTQSEPDSSLEPQEASKLSRVTGIRHWTSTDSSTVVLDLQDQVQYETHRLTAPDRIYFDLHDTSPAPDLDGEIIEVGDSLLTRIRVARPAAGLTRVVLETGGNSNFSVSLVPSPYRLVVHLQKPGSDSKADLDLFPAPGQAQRRRQAIVVPPPTHEDLQLRARVPKMRIVVDAGHGGWDLGTVGRRGLLEKDLVLEIAQRLTQLLESRLGAEVILTRNDDTYIPLDERAEIANQAQADLFVSVHANYSDLPSARGVETYYTNFFSAPGAKDKDIETRQDGTANKNAVTPALAPADLHDRIEQSRRLAASVQRSLYSALSVENPGLRDRGVKEASYVVLTETAMPGILAEVSFVSSPTDEQKLRSDGYREQIAEALYKGIARYAAGSHGVKMASVAK